MSVGKTVTVYLSNGREVSFSSDLNTPIEIKNRILNQTNGVWYYYKNASGEGFLDINEIIEIRIS
ncbi:hypothetical protein ACQCT5_04625 [Sutcliffiella halmapala]